MVFRKFYFIYYYILFKMLIKCILKVRYRDYLGGVRF